MPFPWALARRGKAFPRPPARLPATLGGHRPFGSPLMRLWVPSAFAGLAALLEAAGLKRSRFGVGRPTRLARAVLRHQARHQEAQPSSGCCRLAGVWRRLGASAGSFVTADDVGATFRIRLAGLGQTWPGHCVRPGDAHGICPFAAFVLSDGCPAFRPPQPTCRFTSQRHRLYCGDGSRVISVYACDARSEVADRDSWVFRPASRAARSRSWAAAAVGFSSSRFSDALTRTGRVSSPWPAIDSGDRFRFH